MRVRELNWEKIRCWSRFAAKKLRVVRGDTVLQAGDEVMIFSNTPGSQLRERLSGDTSGDDDFAEATSVKHREVVIPSGKGASGRLTRT